MFVQYFQTFLTTYKAKNEKPKNVNDNDEKIKISSVNFIYLLLENYSL